MLSGKSNGGKHESGVELMPTAAARRILITWEPVSEKRVTATFGHRMKNTLKVQRYAPVKAIESKGKAAFYEQLNSIQKSLPEGDIVIMMRVMIQITEWQNFW